MLQRTSWILGCALLALSVPGCGDLSSSDMLALELTDGSRIRDLAPTEGTVAVIVFDPVHWLECFSGLEAWLDWKRAHEGQVALVMTQAPQGVELRQLAIAGIFPDKILSKRRSPARLPVQILLRANDEPIIDFSMNREMAYQRIAELRQLSSSHHVVTAGDP